MSETQTLSPFEALFDYEQRSLRHVAGIPEQIDAPGSWRGIGFRLGNRVMVSSIAEVNEILSFPALTTVPGTRDWLLGVANVRDFVNIRTLPRYVTQGRGGGGFAEFADHVVRARAGA